MNVRKMRILRNKYRIPLRELSDACGISKQRLSQIELGETPVSEAASQTVADAFAAVAERRRDSSNGLSRDFRRHKNTLLESVEERGYEL